MSDRAWEVSQLTDLPSENPSSRRSPEDIAAEPARARFPSRAAVATTTG
ncbi:hypothetical protein Q2K19_00030 [Micromonospora soli]|nr:hypothetical protein [Micromonospora sp. NBRC 110009]WKT98945.1 hypothetical protein Q2K19_00030 [Micromonospora sp. NBRC 110009]